MEGEASPEAPGPASGPAEPPGRLRLHAVELEGFKSYRGRALVGAPFGDFTAVVGPNGCGKSVVGEAIAFALGGNAWMMRARNLGSLVNHTQPPQQPAAGQLASAAGDGGWGGGAAGGRLAGAGAEVGAAQPPAVSTAEVILHFEVLSDLQGCRAQQPNTEQRGSPAAIEGTGGDGSQPGQAPVPAAISSPADGQPAAQQAEAASSSSVVGMLQIRRQVTRAGRSDLAVRQLPAEAADGRADAAKGCAGEAGQWRSITPAGLRELLAPFGIQTEAVDRFIVTQHRQAVQVADPVQLARFLELLIGTAAIAEQLGAVEKEAAGKAAAYDEEEERLAGLELRRQQLQPEVVRWQRYQQEQRRHTLRKVEVLGQQSRLLQRQLGALLDEAAELDAQVAAQQAQQAAAKSAANELLQGKLAADRELQAADKAKDRTAKKARAAQLQATKIGVQLKAAEAAAGRAAAGGDKAGGAQKKLRQAEKEAERQRKALAAATAALADLQRDEALVAVRVAQLHAELDVPGGTARLAAELAAAQQAADGAAAAHAAARQRSEHSGGQVAGLESELSALAAAAAAQQRALQETAAEVQGLRESVQRQLEALHAAEAQLGAARQQQYGREAAHQAQQASLGATEARLAELERPPGTQQAQRGAAGRQTADEAVAALASACALGSFHGRLHSVARLAAGAGEGAGTAVNAALLEVCNLSSFLVVADRGTAQQAVSHFERYRVGVATCKIVSELQQQQQAPAAGQGQGRPAAAGGSASSSGGLTPLAACVEPSPAVSGARALISHLLHNWWLAPDRQAALAAVQADRRAGGRRRNVVSRQGDVFKADGEIVGGRSPPSHLRPYLLSGSFVPPGQAAAAPAAQPTAADKERLRQEAASLKALAQQAAAEAREAAREAEEAAAEVQRLQEQQHEGAAQLAAAERRLAKLQSSVRGRGRPGQGAPQQQQQLERRLAACKQQASLAAAAAEAAEGEEQAARQHLLAAQAAYEAGLASSSRGAELAAAERELAALRAQAGEAKQQAASAETALAAATRLAHKLSAARQAAEAAAAEEERLRAELERLESAARRQEEEAAELAAAARQRRQECGRLEAEWKAAVRKHEAATRRCQQLQVSRRDLTSAQQQAQQRLEGVQAALAQAQADVQVAAAVSTDGAEEAGAGEGLSRRPADGTSSSAEDGSSSEDEVAGRRRRRPRLLSAGGGGQAASSRKPPASSSRPAASAAASVARSTRSKRRLVESSSSEEEEDGSQGEPASRQAGSGRSGVAAAAAAGEGPGPASSSKRAAAASRSKRAAASSKGPSRGEASADSDSDFELPAPSSSKRGWGRVQQPSASAATAATSSNRADRQGGGRPGAAMRGKGVPEEEDWSREEVEEALEELERRERELQALRGSLSETALREDAAAAEQAEQAGLRLDALAAELAALEGRQAALQEERYSRFHSSLAAVNERLSGIYARLTGGQGDAYCSHAQDRLAAFADGVTFHVRPDRQRWRPFAALSGGQQALATLALCFALQAAAPSPFYFFDEIDCALDTVNAARVADYIASHQAQQGAQQSRQAGAQFIVVSHKPQVYERAGCLVGVTSLDGASQAVTVHMAGEGAGEP